MHEAGIPACYFPTTVVFVDDSKDFLLNFSLQFDPSLAFQLCSSAVDALQFIKSRRVSRLNQRCFTQNEHLAGCPTTSHTINLDLAAIHSEVYEPERFSEVSVVVVDYTMPGMDGLAFCEALKQSPIKKVLLTGQADAQTAIDAFNAGIIDRFLLKSDPDVLAKVNHTIAALQLQYFQEMTNMTARILAIDEANFLRDPALCRLFQDICKQYDIVEYYLTENTGTFLLLSSKGSIHWLVVNSEQDMQVYLDLAQDNQVPAAVMKKIRSKAFMPHFWHADRFQDIDPIEWESFLYPAQHLQGVQSYYYSVLDNPAISSLDVSSIRSYDDYLEQLDDSIDCPATNSV